MRPGRLSRNLRFVLSAPVRVLRASLMARPIRFTRFGALYVVFTVGVGAAAINTGNNLLYLILGILLGMIVVSGILSDSGLWGLNSEWSLAESAYAGERATIEVACQKRWFPGVLLSLTARWQNAEPSSGSLFWAPAGRTTCLTFQVIPRERGVLRLESLRCASFFPFGLFEKFHVLKPAAQWIVYPRRQQAPRTLQKAPAGRSDGAPAPRAGAGDTPLHLRDYRSGDPVRYVHWKTSAKRGRWIVHEMQEERSDAEWLVVRAWPSGYPREKQEDFVSFLASLFQQCHERGRPLGLRTPDASFAPEASREGLHRVLRYLALVDLAARPRERDANTPQARWTDAVELWQSQENRNAD